MTLAEIEALAEELFGLYLDTVSPSRHPATADIRDLWRRGGLLGGFCTDALYDHLRDQP